MHSDSTCDHSWWMERDEEGWIYWVCEHCGEVRN